MKLYLRVVATLAVAASVLAGCSVGGTSDKVDSDGLTQQSRSGNTEDSLPLSDINPVPRSKVEDGGRLIMAVSQLPDQWNGMHKAGQQLVNMIIDRFTMPTNWDYTEDGSIRLNRNFIERVDVNDGPPQVVTLTLNPEASWTSGMPITWKDYEATWKAGNGTNRAYAVASTNGFNQIEKVEKGSDDFEVVITYKSTYPDWTLTWATVQPKTAIDNPGLFEQARRDGPHNRFAAGPFKFGKIDEDAGTISLLPNDNWWGDTAKLDEVQLRTVDPDQVAQAFVDHEVDVIDELVNAEQYKQVLERGDAEVRAAGGLHRRSYIFNTKNGVLQDLQVRQALAKAVDRKKVAETLLADLPTRPEDNVLGNHFFMPGQRGYKDNSTEMPYDPQAAAQQLEDDGWVLEDGAEYRTKDGRELTIEYTVVGEDTPSAGGGKLFQQFMKEIGVKVNITSVPLSRFPDYILEGDYMATSFGWIGTPYAMANVHQFYGCDSNFNFTNICDDRVDEYIKRIDVEMDRDERVFLTNKTDRIIWEDAVTVPLYRRPEFTAVPKNLANYGSLGLASVRVENIGFEAK